MSVFWTIAGTLAVFVAVVHGYLGLTKVVPPTTGVSDSIKRIYLGLFGLSAVYWAAGGVVLVIYAGADPSPLRTAIGFTSFAMYFSGALVNAWATRGKHFGWAVLVAISLSIFAGF